MKSYRCWELDGDEVLIEAPSRKDAFDEYTEACDWWPVEETQWVDVQVAAVDDEADYETFTVELQPEEPPCTREDGHDWQQESVWGHGGGVIIKDRCEHCGARMITDTWAQRMDTGEQGLTSISYETQKATQ
jgi:hypothetical protein